MLATEANCNHLGFKWVIECPNIQQLDQYKLYWPTHKAFYVVCVLTGQFSSVSDARRLVNSTQRAESPLNFLLLFGWAMEKGTGPIENVYPISLLTLHDRISQFGGARISICQTAPVRDGINNSIKMEPGAPNREHGWLLITVMWYRFANSS